MKEIEVKILKVNPREIEKKIFSLGGKKTGSYLVKDSFYEYPDKKLKSHNSILRIRTYDKVTELTFKQAIDDLRTPKLAIREELQVEVSNEKELRKIILALGLTMTREREKKRTSFVLGKTKSNQVKIEIDVYPGVPPYLEIEGDAESIPIIVKKLGFEMKDTTNISATQVLKKYNKNPDFLKF